ncbi:hypothetical protein IVB18_46110 [Bradyrhizobium sp. 186]|uniref:hypothetical protein n=1 Tax=Bradyrhizobium sp. 186 TaxID=2782654 RepID=UPI002001B7B9|nr:hypothetical protein [Bradyrhizobium sp. 186]UPK35264.1 hypothetical protein IVB18_46110 [Bradyrhizobium sp. 186]
MTPIHIDKELLQAAKYASLRAHPTSEQAIALVAKLASMVEEHTLRAGLRQKKRKDTAGKLEYATGAFLADLLRPYDAEEPNGWVYKSLNKTSFTGASVGRHAFDQLYNGLEGLGFLQHVPGHKVSGEHSDMGKYAARFRATPELLTFCTEQGVPPSAVLDHFEFEYDLPKHPVELRKRKLKNFFRSSDIPGKPMEFERTPALGGMEHVISEMNEFFAKQILRGGQHHGYVRIFQNGDDPHFDWNKGGRLYSQHFTESYQVMSSEARRKMTINGEPVAEIDLSGSYLTIFLSLHGLQLDLTEDPYLLPGLGLEHRGAVKQWFVGTFGNSKPIKRWPKDMLDGDPGLSEYRPAEITKAVFTKYPVLKSWGEPLNGRVYSWADLMWLESSVMFSAMLDLMHHHSTPSLSVHDSLIVPVSKAEVAEEALRSRFQSQQKVVPRLKFNGPLSDVG